jgi:5-deoxy-glucuronate isomerase
LAGREGVFDQVSDWIYAPVGSKITLAQLRVKLPFAPQEQPKFSPLFTPKQVMFVVEVRGAGSASRQVTNYATPDSFKGAHKISVCEVITPGGNVSSWPPHRHDGIDGCVANNEEIYYFRIGKNDYRTETPREWACFTCIQFPVLLTKL